MVALGYRVGKIDPAQIGRCFGWEANGIGGQRLLSELGRKGRKGDEPGPAAEGF